MLPEPRPAAATPGTPVLEPLSQRLTPPQRVRDTPTEIFLAPQLVVVSAKLRDLELGL